VIWVLVIGKSSHETKLDLCLVARAFGASNISFAESNKSNDRKLSRYCDNINGKWGGKFSVSFFKDWKKFLDTKKNYVKVYLTRYGLPVKKVEYALKTYKNILIMVSMSESVKSLYKTSDFNVSITTQPHSSASSIAIFLHNFYDGRELAMHFENAKYKIIPEEHDIHIEKSKN
jgi:tRNA (cytidine56-2'-O)-methyltransferase